MKRIDKDVDLGEEMSELMKGFVPRVGDQIDIKINDEYSRLLNLQTLLSDGYQRAKEKGKVYNPSSAKLMDIKEIEKRLKYLMGKRK